MPVLAVTYNRHLWRYIAIMELINKDELLNITNIGNVYFFDTILAKRNVCFKGELVETSRGKTDTDDDITITIKTFDGIRSIEFDAIKSVYKPSGV